MKGVGGQVGNIFQSFCEYYKNIAISKAFSKELLLPVPKCVYNYKLII